ncbi:MAG: zinc ribbon domain-containing protein [Oscillospiraceae bacterium]|nr:zinc ribbon domain-containing protein [Oscillospiraceae bacterium]
MENNNSDHTHGNGAPQEEATKKCPYCGETLPEKIAFCLYCMKPLTGEAVQKLNAQQQNNEDNRLQKRLAKTVVIVGAAVILLVIVTVIATSYITTSFLMRQSNYSHYQVTAQNPTPTLNADNADIVYIEGSTPPPEQSSAPPPTEPIPPPPPEQSAETPTPVSTSSPTGTSGRWGRPSNPAISLERAIEIAYADLAERGINASFRSDSGMSWERGQWVWELLFSTQGERMPFIEYYINLDNGSIVKFEWDD